MESSTGKVSFVATPIGNLGDITLRALETLKSADLVACEDTRHSQKLLNHYELKKRCVSLHEHNEAGRSESLLENLSQGQHIAVISDAGLPLLSDPGARFLQKCIAQGIPTEVIPGACALTTALVGSGLPVHPFHFGGFLPVKKGGRRSELSRALESPHTTLYYESCHRLLGTLEMLAELAPEHRLVIAKELTKTHESYKRGTALELYQSHQLLPAIKGEYVLLIAGHDRPKYMSW